VSTRYFFRHQAVCTKKREEGLRFRPKFNTLGRTYGRYIAMDQPDGKPSKFLIQIFVIFAPPEK